MADTITTYRQAMAAALKDESNEIWSAAELDAALRLALAELSQRLPNSQQADLTLAESGRQVPIADLPGCMWVEEVWWPFAAGEYPPNPVPFEQSQGELRLLVPELPAAGDVVRLLYAARQTVAGLDEASETSVPEQWRGTLVLGAAAYAALAKCVAMAREYNWSSWSAGAMQRWGETMLALFQARLRTLRAPGVQPWVSWA